MNEKSTKNFANGKVLAYFMGGAVYVGVVLLYLAFYESLMSDNFTGILKTIASIGAALVAINAVALPVALHFWTVTGIHKWTASIFYALDVVAMGMNVLAASGKLPVWTQFAPATIVFVLAGWALLFITDPGQRALVKQAEAFTEAQVKIVRLAAEFLDSDLGKQQVIEPVASKLAARLFNEHRLIGSARSLPVNELPASEEFADLVEAIASKMNETKKANP